jgi:hypothetical protein
MIRVGIAGCIFAAGVAIGTQLVPPRVVTETQIDPRYIYVNPPMIEEKVNPIPTPFVYRGGSARTAPGAYDILTMPTYPDGYRHRGKRKSNRGRPRKESRDYH